MAGRGDVGIQLRQGHQTHLNGSILVLGCSMPEILVFHRREVTQRNGRYSSEKNATDFGVTDLSGSPLAR